MSATFRIATHDDLPTIVAIYNQAIPGRQATADTDLVTVAEKELWFASYDTTRPIWVIEIEQQIAGWVALESFYGRPAYQHTVEISLYIDENQQQLGLGQAALDWVISQLVVLKIDTIVAFIFAHNQASQGLFRKNGFSVWGHLPEVAIMDGQRYSLEILGRKFS